MEAIQEHSAKHKDQHIIVLSGHNHFFEHYSYNNGEKQKIDFIVTGGGGAPLEKCCTGAEDEEICKQYRFEECYEPDKKVGARTRYRAVRAFSKYHFVVITLDHDGTSRIKTMCLPDLGDKKSPMKLDTKEWDDWKATEEACGAST